MLARYRDLQGLILLRHGPAKFAVMHNSSH
jgi:hypothetical protein